MSEFPVRIVKLEPLRVASVHGFGPSPEGEAWQKLVAWAKPKGYLDDPEHHRIFGFNNPDPAPGSPNYGYEFWMVVGPEVQPEAGVEIKDFPGGLYAVARCDVQGDPWRTIPAAWKKLVQWRENSQYQCASHQWLEEHLEEEGMPEGDFNLDLYLPIAA
ncbi:MAG: GyrI-like domain-containing protein [Chloroflexi bacterium]|nr:GyrI-like domain-containing protein [Chloroflexota bacterium]